MAQVDSVNPDIKLALRADRIVTLRKRLPENRIRNKLPVTGDKKYK